MSQLLLDLPSELITHIFDFLICAKTPRAHQVLTLESICKKISQQEFIRSYFDNIWKLLLLRGITEETDKKEFEKLDKSLRKKTYRRVYCILSTIRQGNQSHHFTPKSDALEEYKVVMYGCGGVGKSSLAIQFVQGIFISEYDPTIEDSYCKSFNVDGKNVVLEILDTAVMEEHYVMRAPYLKCADIIVHVMSKDFTREKELENYLSKAIRAKDDVSFPIVFAVNKIDLSDDFPMDYIYNAVRTTGANNYSICKTSAKTGEGVTELFDRVVRKLRFGKVKTIEYIKKILSMDRDILKQNSEQNKQKCLLM